VSGTDPDPRPDQPIDSTRAYRPGDAAPQPPAENLPKIPGITLHFELARGGMGVVYSGRQDFLDRRVAVKLLSVELGGESFVQRFQREAKILAGIKHPNIVACHMAGQTDDGQSYLVMEFIDGPSLKKWIADHGPVPVKAALRTARAVGQALAHAFTLGVIHRDVKPENILLETVTSTALDVTFPFTPKLVDLGLARASSGSASLGLTSPGSVMGTPATMSPEQYDEPDAVDFRTDVYGLGCALYEMLVGRAAFRGKRLSDIVAKKREPVAPDPCAENPEVPAAVGALVQSMLATDREDRPRSYRDLDEQLTTLLGAIASAPTRTATQRFVGEETEVTTFRRPTLTPDEPSAPPAKTVAKTPSKGPAKPPGKDAGGSGPGLLKTAEINFLAEALGGPAGADPAAAEPQFHTRPPAGGAPAAPQWSTRPPAPPEPVGGSTHASAPPAAPTPLVAKSRRGAIVGAAIGIAALGGIAWIVLKPSAGPSGDDTTGSVVAGNRQPRISALVAPRRAAIGEEVTFKVTAADDDNDRLRYSWSWDLTVLRLVGRDSQSEVKFEVADGLEDVEAVVTVEVNDDKSLPVRKSHTLVIAGKPPELPVMAFKTDRAWRVDQQDSAWNAIPDTRDPAVSCRANRSRRTLSTSLGREKYWAWSGSLESAEDQGTKHATLGLRFEIGDRGYVVQTERQKRGGTFVLVTEVLAVERVGDSWNPTPLSPPLRYEFAEPPVPDDAKDEDIVDHRGWFSVERRETELRFQVGHASRAATAKEEKAEPTGDRRSVALPADADVKLTLFVDQGIGRFRVERR
jgi:serine/threonine protein kinase